MLRLHLLFDWITAAYLWHAAMGEFAGPADASPADRADPSRTI
jgi:hypothetical protein